MHQIMRSRCCICGRIRPRLFEMLLFV